MDLGPDPADHDEVVQRFARRLFVLAYHLTGDSDRAGELCQECLIRSLLAPDFPTTEKEAGVFLHRGLISLWREREAGPARGPVRLHAEHAGLWRALSRLDPVSRAVLVLRVAAGLEYETIGKVLDMASDVVYARLLQARGGLREGERALETSLFETMNLYLDERLTDEQRAEFERRLLTDPVLRERVEFHRGLTLELHEEAPALPRDFPGRLRERLEKSRETLALLDRAVEESAAEPAKPLTDRLGAAPAGRPRSSMAAAATVALLMLAVGVGLGLWVARRKSSLPAAPPPEAAQTGATGRPGGAPDEATTQALRSLGYLAPGKEPAKEKAAKESPGKKKSGAPAAAKTTPPPVEPTASPTITAAAMTPPDAAVTPSLPAETPAATPAPQPTDTPAQEESVAWRVLPVGRPPRTGRDSQVIRSAVEWAMLFEGPGETAPEVDFDKEMVVLLRGDLSNEPPQRLVVAAVKRTADAILIECRAEPPAPGAAQGAPGQGVVIPISELPVRVVVR
jgi:RNA polymerase sigma-70 factor, ECF subfamily